MNKYSDPTLGNTAQFELLPVESFNKLTWRSGNDKLSAILSTDPGAYLGEFRSMVKTTATADKPEIVFPVLPWKIVTRKSGRETYQRYSATEMLWRPISARARFVKYERDSEGNRVKNDSNRNKIVATAKEYPGKGSGYEPQKEVFGMVLDAAGKFATYACLVLDAWNSYISYNQAVAKFDRIIAPDGKLIVYKLGTRGEMVDGELVQKVKNFNGNSQVEIEPLDLDAPRWLDITQEFDGIWEASQAWTKCPRWNAAGKVSPEEILPESTDPNIALESAEEAYP